MEPDQISTTNDHLPVAIQIPQAIRGAALTLTGAFALIAGGIASAAAAWSSIFGRPPSLDGLVLLAALSALTMGALTLLWGTRTMVASGLLTISRQVSKPLLGLLGLLLACLAAYLLLAGLALVGLSVFAEAGAISSRLMPADPLSIGVLLVISAVPTAAIGGTLIGRSKCIVGLRASRTGERQVVAG